MNNSYYQKVSPLGMPFLTMLSIKILEDCITTIEAVELLGYSFSECQIIKYLWRLGVKTEDVKGDCQKVLDYIDRAVANDSPRSHTLLLMRLYVECLMFREP